jgi:transposase
MGYIEGVARAQSVLFPEAIDDYVAEDNPVRFIDAFVDELDLGELGFHRSEPAATGRPGYDPSVMLKLYIYGYLNRIRSSRRLEQEAQRNVELMWLLQRLTPDFKTIADFRKDNHKAFKPLFRKFTLLCRELGLFGGELIAVDGSKFKAVNNIGRNFTRKRITQALTEADEKLAAYLRELDDTDRRESGVKKVSKQELAQKIKKLKQRKSDYDSYLKQMDASNATQVSLTDPDSRSMPKSPRNWVSYNVQTAVDDKHRLIIAQDVTNVVTDVDHLSGMSIEAKEQLGVDRLKVVADRGYYNCPQIKACEQSGIEAYVDKPLTSRSRKAGLFSKQDFRYDAESDCYVCPAGERLTHYLSAHHLGRDVRYYNTHACRQCKIRHLCTRNKEPRHIMRLKDEAVVERMAVRVRANPQLMKKRKTMVEHPFGSIKYWNNQAHFLMRGMKKVKAEFSLSTLVYNMRRVMNIVGVKDLTAALA